MPDASETNTPKTQIHFLGSIDIWKNFAEIAGNLAIALGVILSLIQLSDFVATTHRAEQTTKLTALKEVRIFLKEDEDIRRASQKFLHESAPKIASSIKQRIESAGSGEAYYVSEEMESYARVHYHYEQLGALVKLGYVDFPLIFEIIAFPDSYMTATQPIREELAANWKGINTPLPDFGSNINYLKRCYVFSRAHPKEVASCPRESEDIPHQPQSNDGSKQ